MKKIILILISQLTNGCVFNFELDGQKTELEKQVIGEYPKPSSKDLVRSVLKGGISLRHISGITPELALEIHREFLELYITEEIVEESRNGQLRLSSSNNSSLDGLSEDEKVNILISMSEYNEAKQSLNKSM